MRVQGGADAVQVETVGHDDWLFVDLDFIKARPVEDGGKRYVYCEAANQSIDTEGERILKSALLGSKDLFLAKGNIDIDHLTILGYRLGIPDPRSYEIGVPIEVRDLADGVFVKAEIYQGNPRAEWWWKTQVAQDPPMRWFPSVGGPRTEKRAVFDAATGTTRTVIVRAEWTNLGFASLPVNATVPTVSRMPFGAFVKSMAAALALPECAGTPECRCGCGGMQKAITAGYGTDVAALQSGGALRLQSIQGGITDPWPARFRRFAAGLGTTRCPHSGRTGRPLTKEQLTAHWAECEGVVDSKEAARGTRRFLARVAQRTRTQRPAA
jgi:hypothetical protein